MYDCYGTMLLWYFSTVTNPVHDLTLAHHIDACTTLLLHVTHGLHFPSTIALITQLNPVRHYKPWTSSLSSPSIVLLLLISLSVFPVCVSCWLPGLFILIWPFAACLFASLSAACTDLCIVPGYVSALPSSLLLLLIELCLSKLLLFNKDAPGSQRHWPIITSTLSWTKLKWEMLLWQLK